MTPQASTGPIFTSEPMVTRALAAEIRHDPAGFVALLDRCLGSKTLAALVSVSCEGVGDLDIVLAFGYDGVEQTTVGIECKFDHEVTKKQITKESAAVDRLVLVLPEADDAPGFLPSEVPVLTWGEVLDCFIDSRLTAADIDAMPLSKVTVERILRKESMPRLQAAGWDVRVDRGGAGMPSITVESPALPDGRTLRGQVQVCGRERIESLSTVRFEYHVGVAVDRDDADLPDKVASAPPSWVPHLLTLREKVLDGHLRELRISTRPATAGNKPKDETAIHWGARKMQVVRRHLAEAPWLAKGYTDWAFGVKSNPVPVEDLGDLCAIAEDLFIAWHAALVAGDQLA